MAGRSWISFPASLYLETAEADRLNLQAPEITAERFEALLPYAVALDVEKPWASAFDRGAAPCPPGDADPMRYYQPSWGSSGGNWSGGDFSSAIASSVVGVQRARQRRAGLVGLVGL